MNFTHYLDCAIKYRPATIQDCSWFSVREMGVLWTSDVGRFWTCFNAKMLYLFWAKTNSLIRINTPTSGTSDSQEILLAWRLFVNIAHGNHMHCGCESEVSSLISAAEVCALLSPSRGQTPEESFVPSTQCGEAPGPFFNSFSLFK